ncbi:ATP-dependent DNA helicase [Acidipropionibacterium timonense]|uniref:ATP-dependent DNA helicase n=1 Tax=Acidipropionibacterium timonense TaxID=2161818 RepID=UPI00102FD7B0|nr:ATP-dependent DNA helicase [Acidipropionibacterium timonense]
MSGHRQHRELLDAAIGVIGGTPRSGQVQMAQAVDRAIDEGIHLLVQAGTGTGKSLGYLAPALAHAVLDDELVVVATATLALQAQLAHKDIPAALDAAEKVLPRRPRTAVLKGRHNHACLHKVRGGSTVRGQDALVGGSDLTDEGRGSASSLGAEVVMLREWAEQQASDGQLGDRDDAPAHSPAAWAQVSVPANECLGAQRCPFGAECLSEAARERARSADLVVTNHAMLAIDALNGGTVLPEHDTVIIDEAHEVVDRFTGAASADLSPVVVNTVARRALSWLDDDLGADLLDQADVLHDALEATEPGRVTDADSQVLLATSTLRDLARRAVSAMAPADKDESADGDRVQAQAAVREVFEIAERMSALRAEDVVWVSQSEQGQRAAHVAPLSVSGLLRQKVLAEATTILTSATLTIGGEFTSAARDVGLSPAERVDGPTPEVLETSMAWRGIDVGSPFDYGRQGILYVGRGLPRPGRERMSTEVLEDLAELIWAADGRTLGLFASQRNAVAAAEHVRSALPSIPVLCQGEGHLAELTRRFTAEPRTCLFGTLSLWQGVDVPGDTCRLVVIDKIPFPRPDDPLVLARSQAVTDAGGNGFMTVSAGHAALLLAQGAGRLIRRADDRGVVAVLDPRLVTARYGSFLRQSMPSFWTTTDREVAVQALKRLAG